MKYKYLGSSGILVSELGFGTWGIGGATEAIPSYGPTDDNESQRALEKAFDKGINFFDTALVYGMGHSETLVGGAEKESGKKLFIASKVPPENMQWPAADSSTLKETFSKNLMLKTSPYVERIVSIMDDLVDNKIDKKDVEEVISDLELPLMKIIVQETIEHSVKIMAANDTFLKRVNKIWETSDLNLDLRLRKAFLLFLTLQFDPTVN